VIKLIKLSDFIVVFWSVLWQIGTIYRTMNISFASLRL
jgi:hypothetical protein